MGSYVTTYNDVEIFVDDDGWFLAEQNGREIKARSMPLMKKKLAAKQEAIEVLELSSCWGEMGKKFLRRVVRDARRGRYRNAETGSLIGQYTSFYYRDPELEAELDEIYQQFTALMGRYKTLLHEKARRVLWHDLKA